MVGITSKLVKWSTLIVIELSTWPEETNLTIDTSQSIMEGLVPADF